jgi:hypothetical protein
VRMKSWPSFHLSYGQSILRVPAMQRVDDAPETTIIVDSTCSRFFYVVMEGKQTSTKWNANSRTLSTTTYNHQQVLDSYATHRGGILLNVQEESLLLGIPSETLLNVFP